MTIIVNGKTYVEAEYPIATEPSILEKKQQGREVLRFTINARYEDAARDFVDGAAIVIADDHGNEYDKKAFSIAGDIVDHRDGRITVYMGKPTEAETEKARVAELTQAVREWKNAAEEAEAKLKAIRREAKTNAALKEILDKIGGIK